MLLQYAIEKFLRVLRIPFLYDNARLLHLRHPNWVVLAVLPEVQEPDVPREPQGQVLPVRLVGGARQEAVREAGGERAVDEQTL